MGRRELRDVAVRFIFQYDFIDKAEKHSQGETGASKETFDEIADNFIDSLYDDDEKQINNIKQSEEYEIYFKPVIKGVIENQSDIDGYISRNSKEWEFSRIGKMDAAIMRVAVYELLKREDIPSVVTINEAIELAKKYSSEKAGTYINGVLGGILNEIEKEKNNTNQ